MKYLIKIIIFLPLLIWAMTTSAQTILVDEIMDGSDYCDPIYIEASNEVTAEGSDVDYTSEIDGYILLTDGFQATVSDDNYFQASIVEDCFDTTTATQEKKVSNSLLGEINSYPNPFTDYFELAVDLKENASIDLVLFNEMGQTFKVLLVNKSLSAGKHSLHFDAKSFPAGIYFYQLKINGHRMSEKITCIR